MRLAITLSCILGLQLGIAQTTPGIVWSTYYNGSTPTSTEAWDTGVDSHGYVYMLGSTYEEDLAYRGVDMTKGVGEQPILVKFNSAGQRSWATYLDQFTLDYHGMSMVVDLNDNIYVCGIRKVNTTTSAVLVKLNTTGKVIWTKTFTGGAPIYPTDIATDPSGNVFITGITASRTAIGLNGHDVLFGTDGSYSTDPDGFLLKISPAGQTLWGTYCGGSLSDEANGVITDNDGNAYIVGTTKSTSGIAFNGFDNTYGTPWSDGFIVKYDASGAGVWGTYYGGNNEDLGKAVAFDKVNNMLYAGGRTLASPGLAYNGYDNTVDYYDAWLAKFTLDGQRVWATYYGSPETQVGFDLIYDGCSKIAVDASGNVYMAGTTYSTTEIAYNGFDNIYGGKSDAFITKFTAAGAREWATYFGGTADDNVNGFIAYDNQLYMTGRTGSEGLAYRGFDQTPGPGYNAYLLKVTDTPLEKRSFITGFAYEDKNKNCKKDAGELPVAGALIRTDPVAYFARTDSTGFYAIAADPGTYKVQEVVAEEYNGMLSPSCPTDLSRSVILPKKGDSIANINFANEVKRCHHLEVNVTSTQRRRCTASNTVVTFKNTGFADAPDVRLYVALPEFVVLKKSKVPYVKEGNGVYSFPIGLVKAGATGWLVLTDSVICGNTSIRGLTQCTKAWATPVNDCFIPKPTWDKSDVVATARCLNPGTVKLVIRNRGEGNMTDSAAFRLFFDAKLALVGKFKLMASDSLVMRVRPNGKAIYLQADQAADHPTELRASLFMDGCAGAQDVVSTGFGNVLPLYSDDPAADVECLPIIDSFDPNDKKVSPVGLEANHYVARGTRLEYTIRFQNTGTAPAIDVVVADTLDPNLDIRTIQVEGSSHRGKLTIHGKGGPVLVWTFKDINLPDSTSNEQGSHGFIKFSILPNASVPDMTVIHNRADILFDFNEAVATNEVTSTVHDMAWPVDTESHLVTSEVVVLKPSIDNLAVDAGDTKTLQISGSNFSTIMGENIVMFNNKRLTVVSATASELSVLNDQSFTSGDVRVTNLAGWDQARLTVAPPDLPPSAPVNVSLKRDGSTLNISWTSNPEADIKNYRVYRNTTNNSAGAALIASPVSNSYAATGNATETQYYWVTAVDQANHESAYSNMVSDVPVTKKDQQITFGTIPSVTVADENFTVTATATSGLPVSFSSSNTAVATVSGNVVTIVGGGNTFITAYQAGNAEYNAASAVVKLTVSASQTITFATLPTTATVGDVITLNATASSALPVLFGSSNSSVARVEGNVCKFVGEGTVTIRATQPGNDVYGAAQPVTQTLVVKLVTGTETPFSDDLASIYPNPVAATLVVKLNGFNPGQSVIIKMMSSVGSVLQQSTAVGSDDVSLNTDTLQEGVYYLELIQGNTYVTKKFMKY